MTTKDTGGSAFPAHGTMGEVIAEGMTLRDYFAAKAMAALIHSGATISRHTDEGVLTLPARIAIPPLAYEYADAMLAARKEES